MDYLWILRFIFVTLYLLSQEHNIIKHVIRPTSEIANVFPPPATGNPVRPPITPEHVTRITLSVRLRLLRPTISHARCRIMTPADLKSLRKVTWWRVLEYASLPTDFRLLEHDMTNYEVIHVHPYFICITVS